jgi:dTMP kinase
MLYDDGRIHGGRRDSQRTEKMNKIIAIEGADRAGKATQVKNIVEYLRGLNIKAETLDFPQYTEFFGKLAKNYLNGKYGAIMDLPAEYAMMPYAQDRWQHQPKMKEWLDSGAWVILDRYTYSNVFSVAKCPQPQWEEKIRFLEEYEFDQLGIMRPKHNFYLYIPPEISYANRNIGGKAAAAGEVDIHENNFELQKNVSKAYKYLASRRPDEWSFIEQMTDAKTRLPADQVFTQKIKPIIDGFIKEKAK